MLVKSKKDVRQACVLLSMLGEHRTGDIEDACAALPKASRVPVRRVLPEVRQLLQSMHGAALSELESSLKK